LLQSHHRENETEKQMMNLMNTYKMDLGAGFYPTMSDFMNSFSISFALFLFFGGFILWFLLRNSADAKITKGILGISVIFYGGCFITMVFLTFLPPVICTGLIFMSLVISYFTLRIPSETSRHL
jgi:hypothetical protein